MLPVVTRSAEVVLTLVPDSLREAALALGAPRWRVVVARRAADRAAGPGHRLAAGVARAAGETAPLLFTSAIVFGTTFDLGDRMNSLPIQIFNDVGQAQDRLVAARVGRRADARGDDPPAHPRRPPRRREGADSS